MPQWNPHAAVAGWLIPGLGHIILGQRRRGIILCIAITALWLGGLLIGGVSVIDKYDRGEPPDDKPELRSRSWWYWGQVMIAPSIAIDYLRNNMAVAHSEKLGYKNDPNPRARLLPPSPDGLDTPPYEPSFGRVAEQGTLYTALAGMLNLLAMIDVLYCDPRIRRRESIAPLRPANIAEAH
jgi:hypothetical protein